jgi:hypothetical protein
MTLTVRMSGERIIHDPVVLLNFLVKIVDNVHHLILPETQMVQSTK